MGAPAARVFELSRAWAARGCEVVVLTGFPNHPTGIIPPEYRGQWLRREVVDGVHVVRAPIYAAANRGLVRRGLNYVSYGVSASVLGPWLTDDCDVVIATSPQILTGIAGSIVAAAKRVPFVFEVRDLWPRSIVEVGALQADSVAIRGLETIERALYHRADHIVVVTSSFVDEIAATGIDRAKISMITNGVDLELFRPLSRDAARSTLGLAADDFIVSYIGTHGMAHGLDTALDAAKSLRQDGIRLLFVGEGAEKARLRQRVEQEDIRNVSLWDQRPRDEVAQIVAASDLCLVMLRDLPLFHTVIPSKIFEFMGSGRPILTTVDGESRSIIEGAGAGVFCPPENPVALAEAIRSLKTDPGRLEEMGTRGRRHAEREYSRVALADRYLDLLKSVSLRK
jgi:glycosyltransferase involved in cell wall biosynthesis